MSFIYPILLCTFVLVDQYISIPIIWFINYLVIESLIPHPHFTYPIISAIFHSFLYFFPYLICFHPYVFSHVQIQSMCRLIINKMNKPISIEKLIRARRFLWVQWCIHKWAWNRCAGAKVIERIEQIINERTNLSSSYTSILWLPHCITNIGVHWAESEIGGRK